MRDMAWQSINGKGEWERRSLGLLPNISHCCCGSHGVVQLLRAELGR